MAIYEVDGVTYDIPTDDPEVAKTKIREHLGIAPAPQPQEAPEIDMTAQALGAAKGLAGPVAPAAQAAYNVGKSVVGYPLDVARNAMTWTPRSVAEVVMNPLTTAKQYVLNHPVMNSNASLMSVGKQVAQAAPGAIKNIATGLGAGLLGPESAIAAPYQMAAYEQEKIRQNPQAPEYANNPYAQAYRGEYATQGAAGAANRRAAIGSQQYGGVTEQEQRLLESDRLNMAMRLKAAKRVLGQ
jgi:hypothetical protein